MSEDITGASKRRRAWRGLRINRHAWPPTSPDPEPCEAVRRAAVALAETLDREESMADGGDTDKCGVALKAYRAAVREAAKPYDHTTGYATGRVD